jgi:hypothetical protein
MDPLLEEKAEMAAENSQHHFARAQDLHEINPVAAKYHSRAANHYDSAHVYYKTGNENLANDRMDQAERHADEAKDYEELALKPANKGYRNLAHKELARDR